MTACLTEPWCGEHWGSRAHAGSTLSSPRPLLSPPGMGDPVRVPDARHFSHKYDKQTPSLAGYSVRQPLPFSSPQESKNLKTSHPFEEDTLGSGLKKAGRQGWVDELSQP